MTTIEERREIAAKLRKYAECDECESCEECEDACTIDRDDFGNTVLTVLHVCGESYRTCYDRLADLIEPGEPKVKCVAEVKIDGEQLEEAAQKAAAEYAGIDRDELLDLADEMEAFAETENCAQAIDDAACNRINAFADRIREAVGA